MKKVKLKYYDLENKLITDKAFNEDDIIVNHYHSEFMIFICHKDENDSSFMFMKNILLNYCEYNKRISFKDLKYFRIKNIDEIFFKGK